MLKIKKRAQTELSFGMIFSVILIIFILAFGGYVIYKVASASDEMDIVKFTNNLQEDIDDIYSEISGQKEASYPLTSKLQKVCFIDVDLPSIGKDARIYEELRQAYSGNENIFFYPPNRASYNSYELSHIDIKSITSSENPKCFELRNGKINFLIKKSQGEKFVTILD